MQTLCFFILLCGGIARVQGLTLPALSEVLSRTRVREAAVASLVTVDYECDWEPVDRCMTSSVMDRYFNVKVSANHRCEIFVIEGVPAASLLYMSKDSSGAPIVEAFHLNKGLLLLFDATGLMRSSLQDRYKHLNIGGSVNSADFLTC